MSRSSGAAVAPSGWRRVLPRRRQMLWGLLGAFIAAVILVGIGYATTPIPNASTFSTAQATTLYYSDGKTPLARLGSTTRVDVPLSKVPVSVQHAVLAAEDRQYYSEPGISPTGILRALWTDLRGGEIAQGGSTITQQYVKNAYLNSARTFTRKFKEIFIAVKLANTRSKREILKDYLNTIYFGRGAYGIQAAAHAYFRTDVSKLNAAQGAVLAATISQPSVYDPAVDPSAAKARWRYVINGMVQQHWLPASALHDMQYPNVKKPPRARGSGCVGPVAFICQAVRVELARQGFDDARLSTGGYKVITTIDKNAQAAAVAAMKANNGGYQRSGPDKGREAALVSVQPGDGAIRAMYGGEKFCPSHKHPDSCTDLTGVSSSFARPAGSSFKPYTLIAALKEGISLDTTFHGPPHIPFPGTNGQGISNSEQESCGTCTLLEALAKSINTIFVPLAQQVGPAKVAQAAYDAGIPKSVHLSEVPVITLGVDDVSPLDQADAYATIAAQGVRAQPYLVAKVETRKNQVVYTAKKKTERVFDPDVMSDTTYAMTKVFDCGMGGTACGHALTGRPAAGKTGTNGETKGNRDAWFIGFTPQLSTAVWYGNADRNKPVTSNGAPLYGGMLPAATWQQMMNAALQGQPVKTFPAPAHVGKVASSASPEPSSSTGEPQQSETPTNQPTQTSSPTSAPTPTRTTILPSRSPSPSPSPTPSATATAAAPQRTPASP
ncbi:MAG TPA: transglycosylase domain-containing protein [Mycobacteriales bacterium]|nr:transglycosylase domain-containing protein [Mycobacteriales bacterium]